MTVKKLRNAINDEFKIAGKRPEVMTLSYIDFSELFDELTRVPEDRRQECFTMPDTMQVFGVTVNLERRL